MSWIEVKATLPQSPDFALFIEAFREHGIENTLEDAESLVGAIANVQGADDTAAKLEVSLRALGAIRVQSRELPEENWELAWRVFFKPRRVGKHFVVRPTWETHSLQ